MRWWSEWMSLCVITFLAGCADGTLGERPEIKDPSVTGDRSVLVIGFDMKDADLTDATVLVNYSTDGTTWYAAQLVRPSPGIINGTNEVVRISTTEDYTSYELNWDSWADRVATNGSVNVQIMLTPSDRDGVGTPKKTQSFTLNNNYAGLEVRYETGVETIVNPGSIDFGEGLKGVDEPPPDTVELEVVNTNAAGSTTLQWSTTVSPATPAWLQISPPNASTAGTATVTLSADIDGGALAEGPHTVTLTFTGKDLGTGADAHPLDPAGPTIHEIAVSVNVRKPAPVIAIFDGPSGGVPLTQLDFAYNTAQGWVGDSSKSFHVENDGDQSADKGSLLEWWSSDDVGDPADNTDSWLVFTPADNATGLAVDANEAVTVSPNPTGLTRNTYWGITTISGQDKNHLTAPKTGSKQVTIKLDVFSAGEPQVTPTSLAFPHGVEGKTYTPSSQNVTLSNIGDINLDWVVSFPSGQPAWLTSVSPSSGTGLAPAGSTPVSITVNAAGLSASSTDYTTVVRFDSATPPYAPKDVTVSVHVYEPSTILLNKSSLTFKAMQGEPLPTQQTIMISRQEQPPVYQNQAPLSWSITESPAVNWLAESPSFGTCSTIPSMSSVMVPTIASLSDGNHTTTLYVSAPEMANGFPPSVSVLLKIWNGIIGTGTSTTYYPMYAWYRYERTQVIYLASEIGMDVSIDGIALYVTNAPGYLTEWTIRLQHTTKSNYSGSAVWEDAASFQVKHQSTFDSGATGWVEFAFSSPFNYQYNDGNNNLMVDFSYNGSDWMSFGYCRRTSVGSSRTLYLYSDSTSNPTTWSGSSPAGITTTYVPNVKLIP